MTITLPPPDTSLPVSTLESFRTAIDTFGTFHPKSREWHLPQRLLLTELGVEEARLLAWGDSIGTSAPPRLRVPPDADIDIPALSSQIHTSLEAIVSLQTDLTSHDAQKRTGIKAYAQTRHPEPALDSTRLESYLERQRRLKSTSHKGAHLKHWMIVDDDKFRAEYLLPMRSAVAALIALTADEAFVNAAILQDIKAMAWHPVFELHKASHDSQKLQMIRQSCRETYPDYSNAAVKALVRLNQEWREHDEEIAEMQRPKLEQSRWLSYQRKSISAGPGVTQHEASHADKKEKHTAGVFSKLFRRRSIHHHPVTEKKTDDKEEEESPRSMSV